MRTCTHCKEKIPDTQSCWIDHAKRHFCSTCCDRWRGVYDGDTSNPPLSIKAFGHTYLLKESS